MQFYGFLQFKLDTLIANSVWLSGITEYIVNTLRPRQNGWHFPDDIFKRIFLKENFLIAIKISLKFVPRGLLNNIPTSVQIMAWRRPGDKPLSEPMLVSPLTHICVSRPQWVNGVGTRLFSKRKIIFLYPWILLVYRNDSGEGLVMQLEVWRLSIQISLVYLW